MNAYEQKLQARRDRYEARAEDAAAASDAAYRDSQKAIAGIEMGQPILVGHHSESRHRAALARSDRAMRKSCDESDKARYYRQKAASVGTGGISADDPDAIQKLREELAKAEQAQEMMKAANKAIRGNKTDEARVNALIAQGISEKLAAELIKPDYAGRAGFPSYALTNNNANAKRIAKRIQELEALRSREQVEVEGKGYVYREDAEENRVMFEFEGKPAEEVREVLKRNAFKWSPSRGAWVRQLTNAGIYAGQRVVEVLNKLGE